MLSHFDRSIHGVNPISAIPVGLIAVVFGLVSGVGAAVAGVAFAAGWSALASVPFGASDYAAHASIYLLVGGSIGYLSDLCDRAFSASRAAAQQLAAVLDTAPVLAYVKTRDGVFRWLNGNRRVQPAGGEAPEPAAEPLVPPPLAGDFDGHDLEVLDTGSRLEVEETAPHADGVHRYRSTKYPLFDAAGEPYAVCSVSVDTTEQELSQFAHAAAHDLSEPLRMVSSYLELLSRRVGDELGPEADEYVRFALHGARRMRDLLEGLLAYATLDAADLERRPVACSQLVNDVLANLQVALAEREATVTFDPLPIVLADAGQLTSVLQNLISNAIKFVEGDAPRVHVSAEREQRSWRFTVTDNGIGIDPGREAEVFRMFRRLRAHDEYAGSGIGLALCKRIVERHGGRIWVESAPGGGSRFCFTLADPEAAPVGGPQPEPRVDEPAQEPVVRAPARSDAEHGSLRRRRLRRPHSHLGALRMRKESFPVRAPVLRRLTDQGSAGRAE